MNKRILPPILLLILLLASFSGCLKENNSPKNKDVAINPPPIARFDAPDEAYFGEILDFDASKSTGRIISYRWDFYDGTTAEGIKAQHIYLFENDFNVEYPIIYTVVLCVSDDQGKISKTDRQIKIYPRQYVFYLDFKSLNTKAPSLNKESFDSSQGITYELESTIEIQKCEWNVTMYLEKPFFTILSQVSVIFYNVDNQDIIKIDKKIGLNILWKEKNIEIQGELDEKIKLKSIKIMVTGVLLSDKVKILYGGDKASNICFNFVNH